MGARWGRYLSLLIGICVAIAVSWVALTVVSGQPYSYQQLEHATTVIGGPPGFSAGPLIDTSGDGPSEYAGEYYGSSSSNAEYAWMVSRLRSLGFKNVSQDGSAVCQKFSVSIIIGLRIGQSPKPGVLVNVQTQGVPDSGPACPADLFG